MEDIEVLGLENRDIQIYDELYKLQNGGSLRALAQATKLNRGTVYEIIKKLSGLGLVSFTQAGARRRYAAAAPETFLSLIHERREQLQKLELAATKYAEQLQLRKHVAMPPYAAQFYEGDEGVAAILRDVLQTAHNLDPSQYHVIASRRASTFIYNNFRNFSRQRVKLGIFVRVISDAPPQDKLVLAERRQLTIGKETLDGYIIMYGDKTALISLSDTNELSGIVVTDKGIATMQRQIFEQLWKSP